MTSASWAWVGPSEQTFRRILVPCVWAHPVANSTIEIAYEDLPQGAVMHGFYGVADSGYAGGARAVVTLAVEIDGVERGSYATGRANGYRAFTIPLTESPERVTFSVSVGPDDAARHFCFGATLFDG